jgi:hypothetical protein
MSELDAVRIAVHQNNISRYRRLLRTKLTEIERQYVERRLAEERQSLDLLLARRANQKIASPKPAPARQRRPRFAPAPRGQMLESRAEPA